jgi:hypothetical protein
MNVNKESLSRNLLMLKEKIANANKELAVIQGRMDQLMETLERKFGCKTVEEAEQQIMELESKANELALKLVEKLNEAAKLVEDA